MKNKYVSKIGWLICWIGIWFLLSFICNNRLLLADPITTLQTLLYMLLKAGFWEALTGSFLRIAMGLVLGILAGATGAILSHRFRWIQDFLAPFVKLCKTVPVVCFVVVFLIWWGASFLSVAICFLVVFPNVYLNVLEGLENVPKEMIQMAEVLGFSMKTKIMAIYLPALKPFVLGSLRYVLGMCWKSGVAAEVIGTPDFSIGERLYMAKIYLDTGTIFAWILVILLLSSWFEKIALMLAESLLDTRLDTRYVKNGKSKRDKRIKRQGEVFCSHIDKAYGEQAVLTDFSMTVKAGERKILDWPSGSGKTTLFRMLTGLEKPDKGQVSVFERCGMLFQEDRLCMGYSAIDNVNFVVGNRAVSEEALKKVLKNTRLDIPCDNLSGGEKRRVALVRAMEADTELVILDEPFAGLDEATVQIVKEYIEEKATGRILLMAEHVK